MDVYIRPACGFVCRPYFSSCGGGCASPRRLNNLKIIAPVGSADGLRGWRRWRQRQLDDDSARKPRAFHLAMIFKIALIRFNSPSLTVTQQSASLVERWLGQRANTMLLCNHHHFKRMHSNAAVCSLTHNHNDQAHIKVDRLSSFHS